MPRFICGAVLAMCAGFAAPDGCCLHCSCLPRWRSSPMASCDIFIWRFPPSSASRPLRRRGISPPFSSARSLRRSAGPDMPPSLCRDGVIRAGLIIGGFWALWHVAMWWVGGGWEGQDHLVATVSQAVAIVLFRVVMGWIYANGGRSLFLAIFIHAADNTCWKLFPNDGSHYNPTAIAAVMVIVTIPIIMSVKARREAA